MYTKNKVEIVFVGNAKRGLYEALVNKTRKRCFEIKVRI